MSHSSRLHGHRLGAFVAVVAILAAVAFAASRERLPDSYFYERATGQMIVPGCSEIHCFRVLVPWALGALPGSLVVRWKAYAVLFDAAAAFAVFDLCLTLGLSRRAATIALALSALGFAPLLAFFDPFTSDPLVFWLCPLIMRWALQDRIGPAAVVACVGVFAKEFVVAPLAIFALFEAGARRWATAWRAVGAAAAAVVVWLALQAWLRFQFNYSYGTNKSPQLLSGSYLFFWLSQMSPRGALSAMYNEFGALYILIPVGWLVAPRRLQVLSIAALPFACVFAYVQQPDRALWNFGFLVIPMAALVLEPLHDVLVWAFVALYGMANMRIGAQVLLVPQGRYTLAASTAIALAAVVMRWRKRPEDMGVTS